MEVTKCDRCGAYVDSPVEKMPILICADSYERYKYVDSDVIQKKNICYNCYAELEKWLDVNKEDKDANDD